MMQFFASTPLPPKASRETWGQRPRSASSTPRFRLRLLSSSAVHLSICCLYVVYILCICCLYVVYMLCIRSIYVAYALYICCGYVVVYTLCIHKQSPSSDRGSAKTSLQQQLVVSERHSAGLGSSSILVQPDQGEFWFWF